VLPDIRYRCRSFSEKDDVFATVTVWDSDGWHSGVNEPDLGHPIKEGMSVVELQVTD
jgi:hypothetical protein